MLRLSEISSELIDRFTAIWKYFSAWHTRFWNCIIAPSICGRLSSLHSLRVSRYSHTAVCMDLKDQWWPKCFSNYSSWCQGCFHTHHVVWQNIRVYFWSVQCSLSTHCMRRRRNLQLQHNESRMHNKRNMLQKNIQNCEELWSFKSYQPAYEHATTDDHINTTDKIRALRQHRNHNTEYQLSPDEELFTESHLAKFIKIFDPTRRLIKLDLGKITSNGFSAVNKNLAPPKWEVNLHSIGYLIRLLKIQIDWDRRTFGDILLVTNYQSSQRR